MTEIQGVVDPEKWADCKTVGCVVSQCIVGNKVAELEGRYYIWSRALSAKELAEAVRARRDIENSFAGCSMLLW
jgi:hypothetical protein